MILFLSQVETDDVAAVLLKQLGEVHLRAQILCVSQLVYHNVWGKVCEGGCGLGPKERHG